MRTRLLTSALVVLFVLAGSGCTVYQSIGKSTGGFFRSVSGHDFVHIPNSDWSQKNALLYFYRTDSEWAAAELEAPSVYIDDHHYFNIRNNSFTWLEVRPGERHIAMRRPLLGLEGLGGFSLSQIADATLEVEPGRIYYLRYNELEEPAQPNPTLDPEHPLASGDLQLVTRDYAMQADEIVSTKFLNSELVAPNHAATSIVEHNEDMDYERKMARLEQEREAEIEQMKADGRYREAPWYWPFGGGPTEELQTDRRIEQAEQEYEALLAERERREEAKSEGGWWPF